MLLCGVLKYHLSRIIRIGCNICKDNQAILFKVRECAFWEMLIADSEGHAIPKILLARRCPNNFKIMNTMGPI